MCGICALEAMRPSCSLSLWERAGVRAWTYINRQAEGRRCPHPDPLPEGEGIKSRLCSGRHRLRRQGGDVLPTPLGEGIKWGEPGAADHGHIGLLQVLRQID